MNCKVFAILLFLFAFCFSGFSSSPQQRKLYQAVFVAFGGNAYTLYSINYDKNIATGIKYFFSSRIGLGYNMYTSFYSIPMEFTYSQFIRRYLFVETGVGGTFYHKEKQNLFSVFTRLGLRYQQTPEGFFFRLGLTPFIPVIKENSSPKWINLYGGIGIGYSFKYLFNSCDCRK